MNSAIRAFLKSGARTLTLAWLESLTIRRDPVILTMILLIPTLQIALFGYAIRPLAGVAPVAIARAGGNVDGLDLLKRSNAFKVVADGLTKEEALAKVRTQEALMAIVIPPQTAGQAMNEPTTTADDEPVTIFVDDSEPARSGPALSELESLYWRGVAEIDPFSPAEVRIERLYNPRNRNDWIMTPGLSGVVVMISMLMLGALAIVRERERGTWEALLSTPVNATEAIIGKAVPYLLLGLVQAVLVISCSRVLFDLPLRGNLWAFGVFLIAYTFAHLVIGLAISAAAKNQLQAVQGSVLIYLPSMLLSGFLFPFSSMPAWAQRLGAIFPLTYYTEVVRGVMLRGEGGAFTCARIPPLAAITAISLVAAIVVFRGRLL